MSKMTLLGLNRRYENKRGIVGAVKRNVPLPPAPNKIRKCLGCNEPLVMQFGQIVYWHRECRTSGRNKSKYARR